MDENIKHLIDQMEVLLEPYGFECAPFKVDWYNDIVNQTFKLAHNPNTLCFIIISIPDMFEKAFKPFVLKKFQVEQFSPSTDVNDSDDSINENDNYDIDVVPCYDSSISDPLDQCMKFHFQRIKDYFSHHHVRIIQDFELDASRRPKILVQTAGHVAGIARYYQRSDISDDPWPKSQRIYGTSVHPRYGGWFALRGIAIFEDILTNQMIIKEPLDVITTDQDRITLLERYNFHWQDWTFRDVLPNITNKYSAEQRIYFATPPADRYNLVKKFWQDKDQMD